jgi:hypothetical protein
VPDHEPGYAGGADDALRRLEARLSQASEAAERLFAEAAESVAGRKPPPAGYQAPAAEENGRSPLGTEDLELLGQILHRMRDLIPADLQRRLAEALRELLLAVRALIDWYLERLERRRATPVEVTDIPIL